MPSTFSPLRYPGGKSRFYRYIREILACNDLLGQTYIEPFAGGAGLALKLLLCNDVNKIVINDYDPAIYSVWFSIINYTDALCEQILDIKVTPEEWKKQHRIYLLHDTNNIFQLGFATFFLNRTNISGVIDGGMIGGHRQEGFYRIDARFNKLQLVSQIRRIAEHKERIVLLNKDAKELLKSGQLYSYGKAFINFDPPYVKKGAQLYKNAFDEKDHRELSALITDCRMKWIVTYDICPLIAELYSDYRRSFLDVTYSTRSIKRAQEYVFFCNSLTLPKTIITE